MSKQKKPSEVAMSEMLEWFKRQPPSVQYKVATTAYDSDSQVGKGRRLLLRAFDLLNGRSK